jgi:hypothetical protein
MFTGLYVYSKIKLIEFCYMITSEHLCLNNDYDNVSNANIHTNLLELKAPESENNIPQAQTTVSYIP